LASLLLSTPGNGHSREFARRFASGFATFLAPHQLRPKWCRCLECCATSFKETYLASKIPIIRQINLLAAGFQILIIAIFAFILYQFDNVNFLLYAILAFFAISLLLRYSIPKYHRMGMSQFKQRNYQEAINCFDKSYQFFNRYYWLDKYRFIFILSSSRNSYQEMALVNMAFCYSQIGQKEDAVNTYKLALEKYPESEIAKSGLNMLV
jgi:tetratricopeptide (TPR) repeat protein